MDEELFFTFVLLGFILTAVVGYVLTTFIIPIFPMDVYIFYNVKTISDVNTNLQNAVNNLNLDENIKNSTSAQTNQIIETGYQLFSIVYLVWISFLSLFESPLQFIINGWPLFVIIVVLLAYSIYRKIQYSPPNLQRL